MKWIPVSERLPEKSGYYITNSEWNGSDMIMPNDRSDTHFNGTSWDNMEKWKVLEWLDESPSAEVKEQQGVEEMKEFAIWIAKNYSPDFNTLNGFKYQWTNNKGGHICYSIDQLLEKYFEQTQ